MRRILAGCGSSSSSSSSSSSQPAAMYQVPAVRSSYASYILVRLVVLSARLGPSSLQFFHATKRLSCANDGGLAFHTQLALPLTLLSSVRRRYTRRGRLASRGQARRGRLANRGQARSLIYSSAVLELSQWQAPPSCTSCSVAMASAEALTQNCYSRHE